MANLYPTSLANLVVEVVTRHSHQILLIGYLNDLHLHGFCRYLYCDDVPLEADTVLPNLYAAKKYIMPHLKRVCVEYLETNVDASNACLLLSQSRILEEPELTQRCLDVIDSRTEEALQSDSFTDIDYQTLEQILSRDTLFAKETLIFAAATRWAEAECTRQGREITPDQCREVLGDALYLVRLATMSQDEFADGAGQSGILSKQEIIDIFFFFSAKNKPKLRFSTIRRKGQYVNSGSRFKSMKRTGWSFVAGKSNSIQFSVNKVIYVAGFGQYGANEAAEYHVDMALKDKNGTVLREKRHKMSVDGSCSTTRVLFDCPVKIEADTNYTASFDVDYDGDGHYGVSGMPILTCDGINFKFTNSAHSRFTNVSQGQIPEIIFY